MREQEEQESSRNFELIEKLVQAAKQESLHADLLPYQEPLLNALKELVVEQQLKLKEYLQYEEEDENKPQAKNFRFIIYNTEIERVQYLMKMYLRSRLKKIQLYCFHFVKHEPEFERLASPAEIKFLRKYAEMRYDFYRDNVFRSLVRNYRDFKGIEVTFGKQENETREKKIYVETKQSMIELNAPNEHQYVFASILNNSQQLRFGIELEVSNVSSEQTEVVPLGTIIYAPLRTIKERLPLASYRLL